MDILISSELNLVTFWFGNKRKRKFILPKEHEEPKEQEEIDNPVIFPESNDKPGPKEVFAHEPGQTGRPKIAPAALSVVLGDGVYLDLTWILEQKRPGSRPPFDAYITSDNKIEISDDALLTKNAEPGKDTEINQERLITLGLPLEEESSVGNINIAELLQYLRQDFSGMVDSILIIPFIKE